MRFPSGPLALAAVLLASGAQAATFVVDSTADEVDSVPGDASCRTASATCTLRAALQEANALAGPDVITLGAGVHVLALDGDEEDLGATGDLDVLDHVTIQGAGMDASIVSAGGLDRTMDAAAIELEIRDVTLRDGYIPISATEDGGGNLRARGTTLTLRRVRLAGGDLGHDTTGADVALGAGLLTVNSDALLEDCIITGNGTTTGPFGITGGGVCTDGSGLLRVTRSLIENNGAALGGGLAAKRAEIRESTLRGNTAQRAGGLWLEAGTISDSTIEGNRAVGRVEGCAGFVVINAAFENVTVSGNVASTADGTFGLCGGGCTYLAATTVTFDHVTIAGNSAVTRGGGYCNSQFEAHWFSNSIIADNIAPEGPDVSASLLLRGPTWVGDATGVTFNDPTLVMTGPAGLGPLADNGGPTLTHALLPGSGALDAADDARCAHADGTPMTADQRGAPRALDGDGDGVPRCDLGAFELDLGLDTDGDTVPDAADCAPSDPTAWGVPLEPQLRLSSLPPNVVRVSWNDVLAGISLASSWDIASGEIASLGSGVPDCLARAWPSLSHDDARPVPPSGWYYLVRPVSACSPGWGTDSRGAPRLACP